MPDPNSPYTPPRPGFMPVDPRTYTAMLKTPEGWRPVGTEGDRMHARSELIDWMRSGTPKDQLALGCREVPAWEVLTHVDPECGCYTCSPPNGFTRMYVCPRCGDKRCPGAIDHSEHPAESAPYNPTEEG